MSIRKIAKLVPLRLQIKPDQQSDTGSLAGSLEYVGDGDEGTSLKTTFTWKEFSLGFQVCPGLSINFEVSIILQ